MILWIALILTIRSLLLALFQQKKWYVRLFDFVLSFLFAVLASILFLHTPLIYDPVLIMITTALIGIPLALRLYGFSLKNRTLKILKGVAFGSFGIVSITIITVSGFTHLTEDRPVMKITITGKRLKKWVEWKNPLEKFQETWVDTSEVVLETVDGKFIGRYFIYGDLVGLRARVIRWNPILNFLGIPNICYAETIYNGYRTASRHNRYPHLGYPLPLPAIPLSFFYHLWESFFYKDWHSAWIKSGTLESNYFPLLNENNTPLCGTFFLSITEGGLSSNR